MENKIKKSVEEYFKNLDFNEKEHKYTYNNKIFTSVSNTIKKYYEPFDTNSVASSVAKKRNITREEVLKEWDYIRDTACNTGHKAHTFGENYKKGNIPTTGYEEAIVSFWNDLPSFIIPIFFELKMFSKDLNIAGTSDIILYNTLKNTLIIADYKTNKDLFKNFKEKKLIGPFNNLLDNNFNKYQIQLSLYQILLEQTGFKVSSRKLIWIKNTGTYEMFDTQDFTEVLIKDLKNEN